MIILINDTQRIPQTQKFLLNITLDSVVFALVIFGGKQSPKAGIGIGVKKCGEQIVTKDSPHLLLHLGAQVVTAQVMQVFQVAINLVGTGK